MQLVSGRHAIQLQIIDYTATIAAYTCIVVYLGQNCTQPDEFLSKFLRQHKLSYSKLDFIWINFKIGMYSATII